MGLQLCVITFVFVVLFLRDILGLSLMICHKYNPVPVLYR